MEFLTRTGKPLPQSVLTSAENAKKDPVNRREFLAIASAFGATSATAYGMLGMAAPARAAAHANLKEGGTVRMQMEVRALKDPRTYDWSQIANFSQVFKDFTLAFSGRQRVWAHIAPFFSATLANRIGPQPPGDHAHYNQEQRCTYAHNRKVH